MSVDDKYTYPGSGGVLVNTAGYRTHAQLDAAMNDVASITMAEVRAERVPDRPDYEYLRGIHERMFGDLVPGIAGQIRDTDVQATGTGIPYCRPEYIDANLTTLFGKLEREDYLTGLDANTFADRLAERWGELSAIHPYRDGNTRSQSTYVSALAERAGHPIDWERVDVDELRFVRLQAVAGNDRPLADYVRTHLVDVDRGAGRDEGDLDAFERRDRDMRRAAGLDPDVHRTEHRGAAGPTMEQWPSPPEQARGHDGIER